MKANAAPSQKTSVATGQGLFVVAAAAAISMLFFLTSATPLQAQTPQVKKNILPPLSMPWRLVGIQSETAALAKPALQQAAKALAAAWLTAPESLSSFAKKTTPPRFVTLNAARVTDLISTGQPLRGTAVNTETTLAIEPVWCTIMDQNLIFVTIADAQRDTLLAATHQLIDKKTWQAASRGRTLATLLQTQVTSLLDKAWQKLEARPAASAKTDALHVGLGLGYGVTRHDEGQSHCLNLLVSEKLAPLFTTVRPLGADRLATARYVLGVDPDLKRPTRVVSTQWFTKASSVEERKLPASFTLRANFIESVFGKKAPIKDTVSDWTFAKADDGTVAFELAPSLLNFLSEQKNSLQLVDMPQAVKVNRAWVYVDRGRAWGLKMRDRMVATVDGETVEGHVVRFYGPEEKLKSPRGYPIHEGAILYIRKNQKLSRPGIVFNFDKTTYPTPYPPK